MVDDLLTNWNLSYLICVLLVIVLVLIFSLRRSQALLQHLRLEHASWSSEKQTLQDRLETASNELSSLEEDIEDYRTQIVDLAKGNAKLEAVVEERDRSLHQLQESFETQKKAMRAEFEALANRIFEEKGKRFSQQNQQSIEGMLKPFREQISEFRNRVDGIQKENHKSAGSLHKELEMLRNLNAQMSQDAQNLTVALKGDKKALGNWGEVQLERSLQLAGLVKGQHYRAQVHLKDERGSAYFLDYLIDLPDGQHLIIDSKASLVAYDAAISASTEVLRDKAMNSYIQALRNHIKDLAEKNYSALKGVNSPNFVLMFLPLESAYIEGLKYCPELYEEAYRKNIVLVSHTTLLPILKTVSNIWRLQNSRDDALALSDKAGEIYNQVCVLAERLSKLGSSMQTASKHYNNVLVSLAGQQGLHGKVERFQSLSIEANKSMPQLDPLSDEFELERLERLITGELQGE